MAKPPRTWTCQRVTGGKKCGASNVRRFQVCRKCGKRRPPTRQPAHRRVLIERDYASWVEEFGERCGICGVGPSTTRRLDRDHDHGSGVARGLLCHRDNRALQSWMTPEWLEAAAAYLRRASQGG